ncbi:MAG: YajQ family cyclic di-GMP-binding protein [Nitrospiraceae bacterium]|nr:MAG: YajQ family cyclic di-GMP-binding protein [Nitrospiraceae bacterium]
MASDHSFDIVSKVDLQEVSNAVQQTEKEISQRFDFRGSKSSVTLDEKKYELTLISDDEHKLKSLIDILQTKLVKRSVPLKAVNFGKMEPASGGTVRQVLMLQQGIPVEKAKEIIKFIKSTKLKVQAEIQKEQVRVRSKKIDDLQNIIKEIKEKDFGIHTDFINYR